MKTDFLKNLGITDQSVIDQIMAENGRDVNAAKGDLNTLQTRISDLEKDIKTKDATISTLQNKADSVDGLNQKISQLEADKSKLTTELETKVSEITKDHEIENKIRDRKGLNVKAIKALLDPNKDIDEQLNDLEKAEDSSMLFGSTVQAPTGTHLNNPDGGNGGNPSTATSFADAVAKALASNK